MKPKERKNTNSGYERLKIHPLEINNLSPGKFINITLTYLSLIDNLIDNIQYEIFQLSNDVIVRDGKNYETFLPAPPVKSYFAIFFPTRSPLPSPPLFLAFISSEFIFGIFFLISAGARFII